MIKQFAGTTATKILTTAISFLTVILATRYLGAEEYGNISLFVLSISLLQLVSGIAGGPALVYLVPRMALKIIFAGSLIWTLALHGLVFIGLSLAGIFPAGLPGDLFLVSILFFLNTFAYTTLLARKKILQFNVILIIQALTMVLSLSVQLLLTEDRNISLYIYSLYLSNGIAAITGWAQIIPYFSQPADISLLKGLGKMIRYGGFLQMANAVQLLNYRLSYFLIDFFTGRASLGIYTAGVQLSEGIWIFGKSFAVVQYSSISNSEDKQYAQQLSINLIKVTAILTMICLIVLFILPVSFYTFLFGDGFAEVKKVIIWMSPGILALNMSQIMSHYFSGTGKQEQNAISSVIGLAVTAISGFILIPQYGLIGAAAAASCTYTASLVYQFIIFSRINTLKASAFKLSNEDISLLKRIWNKIKRKGVED